MRHRPRGCELYSQSPAPPTHRRLCAICYGDEGDMILDDLCLLTCQAATTDGPLHQICRACWLVLPTPQCPQCCESGGTVEALSLQDWVLRCKA
jgi:hypothetical protein